MRLLCAGVSCAPTPFTKHQATQCYQMLPSPRNLRARSQRVAPAVQNGSPDGTPSPLTKRQMPSLPRNRTPALTKCCPTCARRCSEGASTCMISAEGSQNAALATKPAAPNNPAPATKTACQSHRMPGWLWNQAADAQVRKLEGRQSEGAVGPFYAKLSRASYIL